MNSLIQSLLLLGLIWVFAYNRARMATILISLLFALIAMTYFQSLAPLPWLALAVVAFFYVAKPVRLKYLTLPVYQFFKRVLPPMNSTEMEALEAGDVWWDAELFQGDPDWKEFHGYPEPKLTEAEQSFLDIETEKLCDMLNDWQIVQHDHDLPAEVWAYIK